MVVFLNFKPKCLNNNNHNKSSTIPLDILKNLEEISLSEIRTLCLY